jgi:hypothetical protein
MARGRRAALPGLEPATERGLLRHGGRLVVRCFEEETAEQRDFDLTRLSLAPGLLAGLAEAFARRVAPGAGPTRMSSFEHVDRVLSVFARYVATLAWPPREVAQLTPEHLDGFLAHRRECSTNGPREVGELKRLLAHADGLSEAMLGLLGQPHPRREPGEKRPSYTVAEFVRVAEAARADLRAAAGRIRGNRVLLARWRAGEIDTSRDRKFAERMELLRWADEFADVPRYAPSRGRVTEGRRSPMGWVLAHGTVGEVVCQLHLQPRETAAAVVLMAALTGQNSGVLVGTPAAHHRADGDAGSVKVAITGARKPRRASHSHMELVWSEVPDWISVPQDPAGVSSKDELHTAFGLYMLLYELTARSRAMLGTDRLLVHYASRGLVHGRGLSARSANIDEQVRFFASRHALKYDELGEDGEPVPLALTLDQVRMTYLEFAQKPVAHTQRTLATTYLLRNHGNLAEYQKVVAKALAEEVDKARARGAMLTMTAADLACVEQDPAAVAAAYGIDAAILKKMIAGQLDTVMNACADNAGGHHAPTGEPCRASFMHCLECPCARALPRHLPVQIVVHDRLTARRTQMPPLAWAERFSGAHARLADILDQHGQTAVADARDSISGADLDLVDRFLNRELDLR